MASYEVTLRFDSPRDELEPSEIAIHVFGAGETVTEVKVAHIVEMRLLEEA